MDLTPTEVAFGRALVELGLLDSGDVNALLRAGRARGLDLRASVAASGRVAVGDQARAWERARGAESPTTTGSSGSRLPNQLPGPGATIGGCRIERELARGGAGAVFVATRPDGSRCAIKVLLGGLERADHRERFEREALIGKVLEHPGVVRILDHGEQDGLAYLVMELLEGARPLDDYVEAEQVDALGRARLLVHAAEAVQAAHDEGVVHRDLKPDNVLVTPAGEVKVVDFGLARHLDRERMTQSGAVMGTLHYMAPEQVRGNTAHADARTDVYALGVTLFRLVAGRPPFDGATGVQVMHQILKDPTPSLASVLPAHAPPQVAALDPVIAMATAKDPAARYPSAAAFARDLAAVCAGSHSSTEAFRAQGRRRLRTARNLIGAAGLVGALGLGGWFGWRAANSGPSPEAVRQEAADLARAAGAHLREEAPLATRAEASAALEARLAALEGKVTALGEAPPRLDRARARVAAVAGLTALATDGAAGVERARAALAAAGDEPAGAALAAALAAEEGSGDGEQTCRRLGQALARGLGAPELRRWRARARVQAGVTGDAQAKELEADLDALRASGLAPAPSDAVADVVLQVYREQVDEAWERLQTLEDPPASLRWHVALARARGRLEAGDVPGALAATKDLPPLDPPPPAAAALAADAAERALRIFEATSDGVPPKAGQQDVLRLLRLHGAVLPGTRPPQRLIDAVLTLSTGYRLVGDVALATTVCELCPDDLTVQSRVGVMAARWGPSGRARAVLPALRRAVELAPPGSREQTELQSTLCRVLADQNDPGGAANTAELRECAELASQLLDRIQDPIARAQPLGARSRALRLLGDLDGALTDANEAVRLNRLGIEFRLTRARALAALGRHAEAVPDAVAYATEVALDHLRPAGVLLAWESAKEADVLDEVRPAIETLLAHDASWPFAGWFVRLAWLQLEAGEPETATATLRSGLPAIARSREGMVKKLAAAAKALADRGLTADDLPTLASWVEELEAARGPGGTTP